MKQTIGFCGFCDAFRNAGRNDQFSYEAKQDLFDYLEQYEEDTGEDLELDVVALCCDFYEQDVNDIIREYKDIEITEDMTDDEKLEAVRDYLNDNTLLVSEPSDGVFLFQCF